MVAVTGLTAAIFAQSVFLGPKTDVPTVVKEAFSKQFPGVKAKWENEHGTFEANFEKDGKEMSATFDATGTLLETETEVAVTELPTAAAEYVKTNYKSGIKEAAKITDSKGVVTYEAEVGKKDLIFDASGNFLRESND